jgi:hypothetical protein
MEGASSSGIPPHGASNSSKLMEGGNFIWPHRTNMGYKKLTEDMANTMKRSLEIQALHQKFHLSQ